MDKDIDYIKADIEGFEEQMLNGAKNIFTHKIKKCLLCCYHHNSSEKFFEKYLIEKDFKIEINKGFIIWPWSEPLLGEPLTAPYTRHGVMYAEKK